MAFSGPLPERMLRLLSAEDRKSLGKAGMTAADCLAKANIKNENDLQIQIVSFLRVNGIESIYQRTDKRTRTKRGTPDIMFAARARGVTHQGTSCEPYAVIACAWELKVEDNDQSKEQIAMQKTLTTPPNGWIYRVIRSLDEAIAELRRLGVLRP